MCDLSTMVRSQAIADDGVVEANELMRLLIAKTLDKASGTLHVGHQDAAFCAFGCESAAQELIGQMMVIDDEGRRQTRFGKLAQERLTSSEVQKRLPDLLRRIGKG